jgi:D-methionine transport system ATP-binding protein
MKNVAGMLQRNLVAAAVTNPGRPTLSQPASGMAAEPAIRFEDVTKRYVARGGAAEVHALAGIDLSVAAGSVLGVIGRSGAGKSTLIRLVNGLDRPSGGRIIVGGADIGALDEAGLRQARRSIGMIFQHFNLLSSRTAADNIALPLEIAGLGRAAVRTRVAELLDLVGLADKRDRYPTELSGGQKQRVGIARALATRPRVLLSDEATSALDPETTRQILDLLARINAELGLTILLITHEMSVIRRVAREVAVLDGGRIVEAGPVFDVFTRPTHPVTRSFLAEETGHTLPPYVADRLRPAPVPGSQAVIRILFRGPHATDPVLSRLTRDLGADVNILAGTVDEIAGQPYGTLVIGIAAEENAVAAALAYLHGQDLAAEVIGYVA